MKKLQSVDGLMSCLRTILTVVLMRAQRIKQNTKAPTGGATLQPATVPIFMGFLLVI